MNKHLSSSLLPLKKGLCHKCLWVFTCACAIHPPYSVARHSVLAPSGLAVTGSEYIQVNVQLWVNGLLLSYLRLGQVDAASFFRRTQAQHTACWHVLISSISIQTAAFLQG